MNDEHEQETEVSEEKEERDEEEGFSSLIVSLGRQGNRPASSWSCPIGVQSN